MPLVKFTHQNICCCEISYVSNLLVSKKFVDHTLNSNGEKTHLLNSVNLAMGKIFVSVANFVFR